MKAPKPKNIKYYIIKTVWKTKEHEYNPVRLKLLNFLFPPNCPWALRHGLRYRLYNSIFYTLSADLNISILLSSKMEPIFFLKVEHFS